MALLSVMFHALSQPSFFSKVETIVQIQNIKRHSLGGIVWQVQEFHRNLKAQKATTLVGIWERRSCWCIILDCENQSIHLKVRDARSPQPETMDQSFCFRYILSASHGLSEVHPHQWGTIFSTQSTNTSFNLIHKHHLKHIRKLAISSLAILWPQ